MSTLPRLYAGPTAHFDPDFDTVYGIDREGRILAPAGEYTPTVEHDEREDILIDGMPRAAQGAIGDGWDALTGHTGQHGYSGAVMHASEQWGTWAINHLIELADNDAYAYVLFAIVEVSAHSDDEPVFEDEPDYCERVGCAHEPAGWAVIYRGVPA